MTRAYDIAYLDDAMTSLGAMLDYAVNSCGEDLALVAAGSKMYARFPDLIHSPHLRLHCLQQDYSKISGANSRSLDSIMSI